MFNKLNSKVRNTVKVNKIEVMQYGKLTLIQGTSGCGKNVMLKGVMANTKGNDNHLITTESYGHQWLGSNFSNYTEVHCWDITTVVSCIRQCKMKNIFIEQHCGQINEYDADLCELKKVTEDLDVNITICLHKRREVSTYEPDVLSDTGTGINYN